MGAQCSAVGRRMSRSPHGLSTPAAGALSPRRTGKKTAGIATSKPGQEVHMRLARFRRPALAACSTVFALLIAACGSSNTTGGSSPTATVPSDLSVSSFSADFSYMPKLSDLYKAGHGQVGVILPDTTTSARYVAYDLPFLKQAFAGAGYSASDYSIQNAQGSSTTELAIAQADISKGATVLLVDQTDVPTGQQVQAYAQQ